MKNEDWRNHLVRSQFLACIRIWIIDTIYVEQHFAELSPTDLPPWIKDLEPKEGCFCLVCTLRTEILLSTLDKETRPCRISFEIDSRCFIYRPRRFRYIAVGDEAQEIVWKLVHECETKRIALERFLVSDKQVGITLFRSHCFWLSLGWLASTKSTSVSKIRGLLVLSFTKSIRSPITGNICKQTAKEREEKEELNR